MFRPDEHVSMFARAFMWEKINVRQPRVGLGFTPALFYLCIVQYLVENGVE